MVSQKKKPSRSRPLEHGQVVLTEVNQEGSRLNGMRHCVDE